MGRSLRIEGAGLWYHVIGRGNGGCAIIEDEKDRVAFLARLASVATPYHAEIHAYALMATHFHLLVRTREANLSRFMQRLLTGYANWHHVRHDTYGHLFQGRYHALLVDKNAYGSEVSRYIHLNPVRTGEGRKLSFAQRQGRLRDYRWSSYRAMIGLARAEDWLLTVETLGKYGDEPAEQHRKYAKYVEQGLIEEIADPSEEGRAQSILGRDRFIDRIRRKLRRRAVRDRDAAYKQRQLVSETVDKAVARVARVFGMEREDVKQTRRGRQGNEARQVALWHAWEQCAGAAAAREIGKEMGGVSGCAVVVAHRRMACRVKGDKRLRRLLAKVQ
jgi:REP element-mobilizing transposase RayT